MGGKSLSDDLSRDAAAGEELRFGFGANWADYVKHHLSDERVEIAQRHLLGKLKLPHLEGKTLLDIGCGSGLHSLAALRAGAAGVTSFDYDPQSVATTGKLHELSGSPAHWRVMQGSVLDDRFIDGLPKHDIVYSWGVLHHTGSMWKAIENAARCLHEASVFYIALYSRDAITNPSPEHWLDVKRAYNRASRLTRAWMEWRYAWNDYIRRDLANGRNPLIHIREYKKARGMSYWHDVRDWLGGWPMEFAGHAETVRFCRERLGFECVLVRAGEANTEYVMRKIGARNYWDEILNASPLVDLRPPFTPAGGFAWRADASKQASTLGEPARLMLYEDGVPIGWPNQSPDAIKHWGRGRYGVDNGDLVFSSTDNSDPHQGGRSYQYRIDFFS